MKKILIIVIAAFALCATAAAQPKAIGARLGWGGQLSYEHFLGGSNFLEVDAGLYGWKGISLSGDISYNFMIAQQDPSSPIYNPFTQPTNRAIAELQNLGIDVSNIVFARFI